MMANSLQEDLVVAADTFMAQFLGERNWSLWLQLREQNGFDNNQKFTAWILETVESFIASTESDCSIVVQRDEKVLGENSPKPVVEHSVNVPKIERVTDSNDLPVTKSAKRRKMRKPVEFSNNNIPKFLAPIEPAEPDIPVYEEDVNFIDDDDLPPDSDPGTASEVHANVANCDMQSYEELEIVESYVDENGAVSYRSKSECTTTAEADSLYNTVYTTEVDESDLSCQKLEIDEGADMQLPPLLPIWSPDTTVPTSSSSSKQPVGQSQFRVSGASATATYTCEWCGKVLTDRSNLSRHIKTVHLRVKGHRCTSCGKQFTRSDNYRAHLKTPCGGGVGGVSKLPTSTTATLSVGGTATSEHKPTTFSEWLQVHRPNMDSGDGEEDSGSGGGVLQESTGQQLLSASTTAAAAGMNG